MTPAPTYTVSCGHCGAPLQPPAHGAVVRCGNCRGWTLLGSTSSAALRVVRAAGRFDAAAVEAVLRRHTEQRGLGAPRVLEARTRCATYFAREGVLRAVVRYRGLRDDRSWTGYVGVPVGPDSELPLEVFDPAGVEPVDDVGLSFPELSLDDLDELVRVKLGELVRDELHARGIVAWDIDLHPHWGPEVKLIQLPVVCLRFSLDPPLGTFEQMKPSGTGSYLAQVGGHDGAIKSIELPSIEREPALWVAGVAIALLTGLFVVLALAAALVLVLAP